MTCNHLIAGPLTWVLDNDREVSLLIFFGSNFGDGSLLVGELSWFVLKIVRATEVCESRLHLCRTDELSEGYCAIEIIY